MLRALDPDEPAPTDAYRMPWRVDRRDPRHPLLTNAGTATVDFVRVFTDASPPTTEHCGQMPPGDAVELCLCDARVDPTVITVAWLRLHDGEEYVWRFLI